MLSSDRRWNFVPRDLSEKRIQVSKYRSDSSPMPTVASRGLWVRVATGKPQLASDLQGD